MPTACEDQCNTQAAPQGTRTGQLPEPPCGFEGPVRVVPSVEGSCSPRPRPGSETQGMQVGPRGGGARLCRRLHSQNIKLPKVKFTDKKYFN